MKKKINNPTKFFYKIFILAFIFTNIFITDSFSKSGKGSLKLSKYTMEHLMMYMYGAGNTKYSIEKKKRSEPTVIAISKDGNYSSYFYCPYESGCNDTGVYWQAIKKCEKGSNGSPCFVFAKKRKIVWKNGINKKTRISKKTLKNPVQVAKIIKDLGFYDGDIYQLAGIDQTTGQVKVDKKITGETDNFDYPSLINTLSSKQKNSWKI